MSTKLIYLEDFTILTHKAMIESFTLGEDGRTTLVLNETIFYPQGGGQPYDQGTITSPSGTFLVEEVRFVDGIVNHIGHFESGTFSVGETVACSVNKERRDLNSRIHSAGHVVDMGVGALGLNWRPGKGYHFPDGPYVEYEGTFGEIDKEKLKTDLEMACNVFVQENRTTTLRFMPKEEMHTVCTHVPDYLPEGKPARVVFYGDYGVPCGGTHVSQLGDIRHLTIRKIKTKGSVIQVAYDVER